MSVKGQHFVLQEKLFCCKSEDGCAQGQLEGSSCPHHDGNPGGQHQPGLQESLGSLQHLCVLCPRSGSLLCSAETLQSHGETEECWKIESGVCWLWEEKQPLLQRTTECGSPKWCALLLPKYHPGGTAGHSWVIRAGVIAGDTSMTLFSHVLEFRISARVLWLTQATCLFKGS